MGQSHQTISDLTSDSKIRYVGGAVFNYMSLNVTNVAENDNVK